MWCSAGSRRDERPQLASVPTPAAREPSGQAAAQRAWVQPAPLQVWGAR